MYVPLMDLEKGCNKVCIEELQRVLHVSGVDGYLIRRIGSLYDRSKVCVRFGSRMVK